MSTSPPIPASPLSSPDGTGTPRRVVVVGGGILGASTAFHLATRGARVTVVDSGRAANGASWRTFGWLNAAQAVPADYHRLRTVSLMRHQGMSVDPRFAGSISFPGALAWEKDGETVQVVQGAEHPEPILESVSRLRDLGHAVSLIDADSASALEPAVEPAALPEDGIMLSRDEGWADLPSLVALLNRTTASCSGRFVNDPDGAQLFTDNGTLRGVLLSDGSRIEADAVVVAVGADCPDFLGSVGVQIPARSTKSALLITESTTLQPRMLLRTPAGSVRAEPRGRLVIHTSRVEDETRIVDGKVVLDNDDIVHDALADISKVFVGAPRLELNRLALGFRPIPGDGFPVVGETEIPGCYVAFSHSAATLGPIIGELLSQEILVEGFSSSLLRAFRPSRF